MEKPRGTRVLVGPAGCNRPREILDSRWQVTPKICPKPAPALDAQPSQCCGPPWPARRRMLRVSHRATHRPQGCPGPGRARTRNPKSTFAQRSRCHLYTQVLFPLFDRFLGCGESTQAVPLAGKIPLSNPRIKPRETPSLQRDTCHCHATSLLRTQKHIYSRTVLGRRDPVFSPKH